VNEIIIGTNNADQLLACKGKDGGWALVFRRPATGRRAVEGDIFGRSPGEVARRTWQKYPRQFNLTEQARDMIALEDARLAAEKE
jgi:hypothetical protein